MPTKTNLFIAVNPVGSKFAKALQQGLADLGIVALRCSLQRGVDHQRRGRKVFTVTTNPKDKVEQFRLFNEHEVRCPRSSETSEGARNIDCNTLFARTIVNGTNGRGIVEFSKDDDEYPAAPLYTEYIPKKAEYRVHVIGGKVVDVQQKRKRRGFQDERNTRIRNVHNGYVYTRENIVEPDGLRDLAVKAVSSLGYEYGACDIIWNERRGMCYVLEVNSRPGLMGTTVQRYAEAIKEML